MADMRRISWNGSTAKAVLHREPMAHVRLLDVTVGVQTSCEDVDLPDCILWRLQAE